MESSGRNATLTVNGARSNRSLSGRCAYEWRDRGRDFLECRACASAHTIVRMPSLGHDVLLELLARDMLTGRAKEDAERIRQSL